jgi:hypothetical protein
MTNTVERAANLASEDHHVSPPYQPSRRKRISLSPRKPKPRPRVSDPYPLRQVPHGEPELSNDEPEEVTFNTDITFFDQQTNQFKLIQPEEIDQLFHRSSRISLT